METDRQLNQNESQWLQQIQARGYSPALRLLLDVVEPFAPLAAQCCYIVQPAATLLGGQRWLTDLAQQLEEPGGVAALRQQMDALETASTSKTAEGDGPVQHR